MEFIQTFNLMLGYAKPAGRELTVETPLIELNRGEVIQLGQRMSVPFEKTWSCYAENDKPCGRCRPCATRSTGFLNANVADPLAEPEPATTS
jgi:7-cyano-7-deazaguanine synthase